MKYIIVFILSFIIEFLYLRITKMFNITDKPNERSSHIIVTPTGGGIIYWFTALIFLISSFSDFSVYFFLAVTLISTISFIDDLKEVRQSVRLAFHLIAMSLVFYQLGFFANALWWIILLSYIFCIGVINAYNFMDGINGITGLYSVVVLLSLQYVNIYHYNFVSPDFIWYPCIASIVFLFFNFRKRAKCFAGDVGSISIAFWVVILLFLLIIHTDNYVWVGFLAVYGVDSVLTILHRIYLKQNILKPHRLHFYQVLVNDNNMSHLTVSVIYFFVQLICSILIIKFQDVLGLKILISTVVLLCILYLFKFRILKK